MQRHVSFRGRVMALAVAVFAVFAAGCALSTRQPVGPASVIERLDIHTRKPAFAGTSFAGVGTYEFIAGVATVRVDPNHPANRAVVDLGGAADPDGAVRFKTDVVVLRPTNAAKASRALIVEIANRGNKLALGRLADGGNQMDTTAQAGNAWPMRQGHTLAWVGWQGDVPLGKAGASVGMELPVVKEGGKRVVGRSIEEFVFDVPAARSTGALTYPAASQDASRARLTVRATVDAPAAELPPTAWRYLDDSRIEIDRPAAFDAGAIYAFTYDARDPRPMGLGLLAMRDVTQFLKSGLPDAAGQPGPLADLRPTSTVLMGISQSGRFLRDFVWEGFNAAPTGGRVYDGAMALIAGSRKSYVNMRFAQPGRYSRQHEDHWYPGDQFPFSYATSTDPVSGRTDGILTRCSADASCPKLMHLDSNLEFWQARASLLTTDGRGAPLAVPDNVRLYLMGSTQHGPSAKPAAGICQQLNNPAQQAPLVRAAMDRLITWSRGGEAPPGSRFPDAADLAAPQAAAVGFPNLARMGVHFPSVINQLVVVDHTVVPPKPDPSKAYLVRVPKTDADGHDLAAVRLPEVDVPLATHSGWNLRKESFAPGQLCGLNGIYVPFARDVAERTAKGDPRPSVAERYASRSAYVERVRRSAERLSADGLLLAEDVQRLIDRARTDPRVAHLPE